MARLTRAVPTAVLVENVPAEKLDDPTFDLLTHLGYSKADIEAAADAISNGKSAAFAWRASIRSAI